MRLAYDLGIRIYYLLILLVSPFNEKAKLWIKGRKGLLHRIAEEVDPASSLIWFHCSSLGEFEQGRPVIEKIRDQSPDKKILLTFYSPSGYEIRKNYEGADHVFYLPLDTRKNVKRFLDLLSIEQAYFVKYEFWYHFVAGLHDRNIPLYLISGIFRKSQVFFSWYGGWYRRILKKFDHLFVQQKTSLELLKSIGIKHSTVSGDTRFDRVYDISRKINDDERFLSFCGDSKIIVAGSTWPPDEEILLHYINESRHSCKWIIAPHEIHESEIEKLAKKIKHKTQRFTKLNVDELRETRVLIIDSIGLLSSLYQYAHITYIGGGFGKGIHNTLEAATFGNPVIFGPNYSRFQEAIDLADRKAAFPISGYEEFKSAMDGFLDDPNMLKTSGHSAETYVKSMVGASSMIVDYTLKSKD
ncbi:MAG TPA: 3-deoxy-D-manno-octulosonic acid transferase [Bacteroides sp.]|nr:3-deoxy-D-manno-octulosonic acid transferase [Bacteroides sp.]